jgi:flagellar basal body-associated protein FliL
MKKPYIFGAVAAVGLLAVAYFLLLPMLKGSSKPTAADATAADAPATPHPYRAHQEASVPGLMYPISERVLNLASSGGTPHYARVQMTIEFARPAGAKPALAAKPTKAASVTPLDPLLDPVTAHSAQIDDALVRLIGGMTLETITSSAGQDQLKQKLLTEMAQIVPGLDPINAYFQELVVQ